MTHPTCCSAALCQAETIDLGRSLAFCCVSELKTSVIRTRSASRRRLHTFSSQSMTGVKQLCVQKLLGVCDQRIMWENDAGDVIRCGRVCVQLHC